MSARTISNVGLIGPDETTGRPAQGSAQGSDPRDAMRRMLPAWIQPFLTWLTAKPVAGARHIPGSRSFHVAVAVLLVLMGLAWTGVVFRHPQALWPFLPLALLVTSSGIARLQVLVYHYAAHGTVFRSPAANFAAGRAVSVLLMIREFGAYRRDHLQHHRIQKMVRADDEFAQLVTQVLKLRPGEPKARQWRLLLMRLVSPAFHLRFLLVRARGCFLSGSRTHNAIAAAAWGALLAGTWTTDGWLFVAVAWLLPVTVLLNIGIVLRTLCEHRWPPAEIDPAALSCIAERKRLVCRTTIGVFPASPPPDAPASTARGAVAWGLWWARLLTEHLVTRLFVLVGDAPCHDYHHRRPSAHDWPSYIHARQHDVERGCPGYPEPYAECWGMTSAIDQTLQSLADARTMPAR